MIVRYLPKLEEDGQVSFRKEIVHSGQAGTGLYIVTADLDKDGWKEIIVPGKSGTHILWNKGKSLLPKREKARRIRLSPPRSTLLRTC